MSLDISKDRFIVKPEYTDDGGRYEAIIENGSQYYLVDEVPDIDRILFYANNHDKLVESLREVIDISKSPREHKEARERASKLLAELENDDE